MFIAHSFPFLYLGYISTFLSFLSTFPPISSPNIRCCTGSSFTSCLKFMMLSPSRAVQQGGNRWKGLPPFFFSSHPLTRHPHRPQQGVLLCHKSPGSLNHATDAPLAFLIAVVHLHLYSIREINGSGHGTQVDILLWGT